MKLTLLTLLVPCSIIIPISQHKSYLDARGNVRQIEVVIHRTGCENQYRWNAHKVTEFETKNSIEFDRQGKIVVESWFRNENDTSPASITRHTYDSLGRKTVITTTHSNGHSNSEKWTYHALGKIVQYLKMTNDEVDFQEDYIYNDKNLLINRKSQTWNDDTGFILYQSNLPLVNNHDFFYNDQGKMDSVVYSYMEGNKKIRRWIQNGNPDSTRSKKIITQNISYNDKQGRETFSFMETKYYKSATHIFYNNYDDVVIVVYYGTKEIKDNCLKWGIIPYKKRFRYTYDQKGNWIHCEISNTENDWVQTIMRKIEYWD